MRGKDCVVGAGDYIAVQHSQAMITSKKHVVLYDIIWYCNGMCAGAHKCVDAPYCRVKMHAGHDEYVDFNYHIPTVIMQ